MQGIISTSWTEQMGWLHNGQEERKEVLSLVNFETLDFHHYHQVCIAY